MNETVCSSWQLAAMWGLFWGRVPAGNLSCSSAVLAQGPAADAGRAVVHAGAAAQAPSVPGGGCAVLSAGRSDAGKGGFGFNLQELGDA